MAKKQTKKVVKAWAVYIKNFVSNEYEVMKLRYDPRTGKEGLAVYSTKDEAFFAEQMALALSGGQVDVRVAVYKK
jgi:hypothetical protein